ncbi:MAG TPA: hypothetical protein VK155_07725 [Bacteroidales bacterium]|jgi:hypothetical protein|nr:hypothetical protein [Bacteroidales bacterium]
MKKTLFAVLFSALFIFGGCIKETYEMDKLSEKKQISPSWTLPVFRGNITMSDALKNLDTAVYDNDKFIRLIFKQDFRKGINEFYDTENMISFNDSYTLGDVTIDPFQGIISMTLDQISQKFSSTLRNTFVTLDDGSQHQFPQFPSVSMPISAFSTFTNLQSATFSSGYLDLSVTNNLAAPLNTITINLSNSLGPLAGPLTIPAALPGETKTISIDLAGKTLTNVLNGTITFSGSPGNSTPVIIDLDNSFVVFRAKGRSLKVSSGRIILPSQVISGTGSKDTVSIDPGSGMELQQAKLTGGVLNWQTNSTLPLYATVNLTFPGILRNTAVYTQAINVVPGQLIQGTVSAANTTVDLSTDPKQPYNRIPVSYDITVTSNNTFINFNSADQIKVSINLDNPEFDFVKGYFGQATKSLENKIVDVGIDEILNSIKGQYTITDPRLRINYTNSFAVPAKLNFKATGTRGDQSVVIDVNNIALAIPQVPAQHEASGSIEINKTNSTISQLVSLPPGRLEYLGSVVMNPEGDPGHLRNNYIFGNSGMAGQVEIEIPLEMSFNNFEFSDTTDNFLKDLQKNIDLESLKLGINVQNGLPFDVSVELRLLENNVVTGTIALPSLIKSGMLGSNGTVTAKTSSESSVSLTKDFLEKSRTAGNIIISFKVNTPDSRIVKVYSDYSIDFNLVLSGKAVIDNI